MLIKRLRLICYLLIISLIACKNTSDSNKTSKVIDPLHAALPHGDTLPLDNLNNADREKLSNAIGRTVDIISAESMISDFKKKSERLQVYAFWTLDCKTCIQQHQLLRKLQNEIGMEELELTFVNLDAKNRVSDVNSSIRAQNISEAAYMISDLIKKMLTLQIPPAIILCQ